MLNKFMGRSKKGRRKEPFKLKIKKETLYSIASILLIFISGLIVISFSQQGEFLNSVHLVLTRLFGISALFLPFLFLVAGLMLARLNWRICRPHVLVGSLLLFLSFLGLSQTGLVGREIFQNLAFLITGLGAVFILLGCGFIGFVVLFESSFEEVLLVSSQVLSKIKELVSRVIKGFQGKSLSPSVKIRLKEEKGELEAAKREKKAPAGIEIPSSVSQASKAIWEYPPLSLLSDEIGGKADRGNIKQNTAVIEETLESFGIEARVAEVNGGPAVTQYALEIKPGTKLSRITTLSNDLALALAAPTGQIRIEAPIPGRSLIGVEVPNRSLEFVPLKKMLTAKKMKEAKHKLTVALGLDVSGRPVIADLARMPHVLIAGATGSGKTCSLNSFIAAILFRATPEEVKFILIDPKRVELVQYNGISHLLTPVITDFERVISALKWSIAEMDRRYKLFAKTSTRNIDAYNELSGFQALPYIIIIIDELADIILFAPAEVEDTITRIAQMARATGIHLVISTQRPSVDVLTGLIKANIPCRIAFNVTSAVDSRVILDMTGAEKLLGRGDMLYIPPDQAKPTRIQGTYISDPEIQKLINYLKTSGVKPKYAEEITTKYKPVVGQKVTDEEEDELFEDAVRIICRYDRASASLLQRRLSIGYARAARILDQLQSAGIVGPPEGSKPREVLIRNAEEFLAKRQS
jgi:S-DNA-T family DNA segregation ATPase FtsK/SpoIIIE